MGRTQTWLEERGGPCIIQVAVAGARKTPLGDEVDTRVARTEDLRVVGAVIEGISWDRVGGSSIPD